MNKLLIASQITEILELPSYSKRKFEEDTELDQWHENGCELSSLVHTHLIISHSNEQLQERIRQDILKLETINQLLTYEITIEKYS